MSLKLKNFGLLEFLIIISAVYVVGMLIWTASTRPEVEARANLVKENHKKVVDFINGEINNCGNNDEGKITVWGDPCNAEWIAEKVVNHINDNLKIENPFSDDNKVKTDPDPRIKAEGKAGQTVEMGVIFIMSSNFLPNLINFFTLYGIKKLYSEFSIIFLIIIFFIFIMYYLVT